MANNVEERIVAAKFDSEDFEKGVDKTIKKLDELKKSFNLETTGESVAELGKKTSKSMESASNSLDKLSKSFTSFTGMIKQKLLSGLADEVVGVFFKIKNAVTGLFSSMTTGQISNGLAKYESALTSVRMIVNSYKHLIDGTKINYTESEAYKSIEALQAYADETSYSMDQMTDSMSKMVAAGVSLTDAERNVQGIANACAAAGVNAQDAARAFFNLSQAYSSGYLKYTDYRSLELLNLTNENFQDALIAAAVEAGTLKAVKGKNGKATTYKTQKSAGNGKVTAGKTVTKQNLSEALRYNFVDTDVMDILFGSQYYLDVEDWNSVRDIKGTENRIKALTSIVSTEKMAAKELENVVKALDKVDARKKQYLSLKDAKQRKEYLKSLQEDSELMEKAELLAIEKIVKSLDESNQIRKDYESITDDTKRKAYLKSLEKNAEIIEKMPKKYSELAAKSFLAAREARNFRDVIMAIGDYVSSKFSKVFEHMFGTLETASNFFTDLAETGIADAIMSIADYISEVADAWDTLSNSSGGAMFRESIIALSDAVGDFIDLFTVSLLPSAEDMGWQMQLLTVDFREAAGSVAQWVARLREWFEEKPNEEGAISRLQRLQNILSNISGVFTIAGRVMGLAVGTIAKTLSALSPVFDGLLIGLELITQPISDLSNDEKTFTDLANAIENILIPVRELATALEPVFTAIGRIGGAIAKFFIEGAISTAIMNVQLIGDAFKLFIELFGTQKMKDAEKGEKVIDRIQNDIKSLGDACKEAIAFVKGFFESLFKDLRTLFGLNEEADKQGASADDQNGGVFAGIRNFLDTNKFLKKAEDWLKTAKNDIKKWFTELPGKINNFLTGLLYQKVEGKAAGGEGDAAINEAVYTNVGTPLKTFLDATIDAVQKFIVALPGKLLAGVGKVVDLFGIIVKTIFGGMGDEKGSDKQSSGASVTDAVHQWAENFNKNLQKEIMMLPSRLSHFIRRTRIKFKRAWQQIKAWFNASETSAMIKDWGASIFASIKTFIITLPERIKSLIKSAGALGRSIIGAIKSLFSSDDVKKETQKELEAGFSGIDISNVLKTITDIGKEIVNQFLSWFTGSDDIDNNFAWLGETVSNLIKSIPGAISSAVTFVTGQIGNLWNQIYTSIIGTNEDGETIDSQVKKTLDSLTDENGNLHIAIENIPTLLRSAFTDASAAIGKLWDGLINALTGKNKKPLTPDMIKQLEAFEKLSGDTERANQFREEWAKEGYDVEGVSSGFSRFVEEIGRLISQVFANLPQYIADGLNEALKLTDGALTWLTDHLTSNLEESTEEVSDTVEKPEKGSLQESFTKLGTTISNLIFETIPAAIEAGFKKAAETASTWISSITAAFEGLNKDENLIKSVQSVGESIVGWIEQIPDQIRAAFAKGKDGKTVAESIDQGLEATSAETAKETKDSTLWTTIEAVAADIGSALKAAFEALWPGIEAIFADIPTHIANGLKFAATGINNAIAGLGNWLKKDAAKSGASTKEAAEAVIENVTGGATEGAEKASEDSPFITAVKGLGAVIYKTITETIPSTISSAFEWVGANWESWKGSLKEIFKNVTGLTDEDLSFDNLVKRITDVIKSLPEKIREAFNSIKGNLSSIFAQRGSNSVFKGLDATDPARNIEDELFPKPKELVEAYKRNQDAAAKELETANEGGGFWEAILGTYEELKTYIDKAIGWVTENIGPLLVKGWEKSLETVSKLLGTLGDWLTGGGNEDDGSLGKAIGKHFGNIGPELQGALESIGETIKKLFVEIIPQFIGSALGTIVSVIPDMIDKFIDGFSSVLGFGVEKAAKEVNETVTESVQEQEVINPEYELLKKIMGDRDYGAWLNLTDEMKKRVNEQRKSEGLEEYVEASSEAMTERIAKILDDNNLYDQLQEYLKASHDKKKWMKLAWGDDYANMFDFVSEVLNKGKELSTGEKVADGAKKGLDAAGTIIESLFNTAFSFDEQGNITGLSITSIIAIIGVALGQITKFIAELKEIPKFSSDERIQAKNSLEHVMSLALIITGIGMGFATLASRMSDSEYSKAMGAFDKVTDLVGTVVTWYGAIKGLGSISDIFGAFSGGGDVVNMGLNLGMFGTAAGISALVDTLTSDFASIGSIISGFAKKLGETAVTLTKNSGNITAAITVMDDALSLLGKAKDIAGFYHDAIMASTVLNTLSPALGLFMLNTSTKDFHTTETIKALEDLMGMTEAMTKFTQWANDDESLFDDFKYAISSLGSAMSLFNGTNFSNAGPINDQMIEGAIKFLKAIVGDEEFVGLAKTLEGSELNALKVEESSEALVILASALARLAPAAVQMKDIEASDINDFLAKISTITFDQNRTGQSISDIAANMVAIGSGLNALGTGAAGLTRDKVELATLALEMMASISDRVKNFQTSFWDSFLQGGGDANTFGGAISNLGDGIADFLKAIEPYTGVDRTLQNKSALSGLLGIMQQLALLAEASKGNTVYDFSTWLGKEGGLPDAIIGFIQAIGNAEVTDEQMSKAHRIIDIMRILFLGVGSMQGAITSANKVAELANNLFNGINYGATGVSQGTHGGGLLGSFLNFMLYAEQNFVDAEESAEETESRFSKIRLVCDMMASLMSNIGSLFMGKDQYLDYEGLSNVLNIAVTYINDNFANINSMFDKIDTIDPTKLDKAKSFFSAIEVLGRGLLQFTSNAISGSTNQGLVNMFSFDYDLMTQVIQKFATAFDDAFASNENIEAVHASGKTMAEYLFEGMELAFNDPAQPLQPHITPILELDTAKSQLSEFFGLGENADFNITSALTAAAQSAFGSTNVQDDIYAYMTDMLTPKLDAIDSKLGTFSDDIKGVASSIDGMGVLIDGDRLVGEIGDRIDRYLGWVGINHSRQQTTWAGDYVKG